VSGGDNRWFKRSTGKKRPVKIDDNTNYTYNNNNNNNNNNTNNNNNNINPIFSLFIMISVHYVSSIGTINISLQPWPACTQNKLLIS